LIDWKDQLIAGRQTLSESRQQAFRKSQSAMRSPDVMCDAARTERISTRVIVWPTCLEPDFPAF
jgi:hypothetical protein